MNKDQRRKKRLREAARSERLRKRRLTQTREAQEQSRIQSWLMETERKASEGDQQAQELLKCSPLEIARMRPWAKGAK